MFRSGQFVAGNVSPVDREQVQPNGVDLTLSGAFEVVEPGTVARSGKTVGDRREVTPDADGLADRPGTDDGSGAGDGDGGPDGAADRPGDGDEDPPPVYRLAPGGYVVEYAERVSIPRGHVGFVFPRSTLLRNGCTLHTAVWDPGYEGRGEGLLTVHRELHVEAGARVGQLVLAAGDPAGTYAGEYQRERL